MRRSGATASATRRPNQDTGVGTCRPIARESPDVTTAAFSAGNGEGGSASPPTGDEVGLLLRRQSGSVPFAAGGMTETQCRRPARITHRIRHNGLVPDTSLVQSGIHADGALKDRRNYELYDYEELGRGEVETVETGRKITAGEYSGIKGFRNVFEKLEIAFKSQEEAVEVLELVRYANIHNQKPLVDDELKFIAKYPDIARQIFTMNP